MVFKPNRNEYDGLMLEYSSTCELDKLVDVLAHYHLQDTEYPSRFEFMNKFDYRRERLKVLLLTKNDEKQFSINDETVYKYASSAESVEKIDKNRALPLKGRYDGFCEKQSNLQIEGQCLSRLY